MAYTTIVEQRIRFLGVDSETLSTIKKFQKILEPLIDDKLERFFNSLISEPEIKSFFPNKQALDSAFIAQKKHWLDILFSGNIGKQHFDNAERIGQMHEQIGLSLGYYLGGYCLMLNHFLRVAADHYQQDAIELTKTIQALNKVVFLDIDSVIDSYIESKDKAIKKVLQQAEKYTNKIKQLNMECAQALGCHKQNLADLRSEMAGLDYLLRGIEKNLSEISEKATCYDTALRQDLSALSSEAAKVVRESKKVYAGICGAEKVAGHFSEQIKGLNENYDELQDEYACHFKQSSGKRFTDKIKTFFT